MNRLILIYLISGFLLLAESVSLADHPCLESFPPTDNPPKAVVVVTIDWVKPNTDLEGDDDFVPFYDNHADIFGRVTINGSTFDLPKINGDDFPHWQHPDGEFRQQILVVADPNGLNPLPVSITIEIIEDDEGLTAGDDIVDINPADGKTGLDFSYDLCSLQVTGDVSATGSQSMITSNGGTADDAAEIQFRIGLEDGRPVSTNDLALMDLDLVQVIPRVRRLVAEKATVVMARVANNYDVLVAPQLRLRIFEPTGILIDEVIDLEPLAPGEVKKYYLYRDAPLLFPERDDPYDIWVIGTLDPENTLPEHRGVPDDCRLDNNGRNNRIFWTVVTTETPNILWARVGLLLDLANFVPHSVFDDVVELNNAFIKATYPIADSYSDVSPIPITPLINDIAEEVLAFLPYINSIEPFLMVAELGTYAFMINVDRIIGVLPSHDWFNRFKGLSDASDVTLADVLPRAVIVLPRGRNPFTNELGIFMTNSAHALGHTFGLSVDASLKEGWKCQIPIPVIGTILCHIDNGFDEYKHDPPDGNPARGYWVQRGDEPNSIIHLLDQEQCDSHCFMGEAQINAYVDSNWVSRGRWIDPADYDHLLTKFEKTAESTDMSSFGEAGDAIYISGFISMLDNKMIVSDWLHLPNRKVDRFPDDEAQYGVVRFYDDNGRLLREAGLPYKLLTIEQPQGPALKLVPLAAFGISYAFPQETRSIELWRHMEDGGESLLIKKPVSVHVPRVKIDMPGKQLTVRRGESVSLSWSGSDSDQDSLWYSVFVRPNRGRTWWPAAQGHRLKSEQFELTTDALGDGGYEIKVMASDGIHVGESQTVKFRISPVTTGPAQLGPSM